MHVQSCCFANLNQLLFDVFIAVAVVASLNSLIFIVIPETSLYRASTVELS